MYRLLQVALFMCSFYSFTQVKEFHFSIAEVQNKPAYKEADALVLYNYFEPVYRDFDTTSREFVYFSEKAIEKSIFIYDLSVYGFTVTAFYEKKATREFAASEKVGGQNCQQAQQVCSNNSFSGNSSGYGTQELNSSNHGCLAGNEHNSSWYYINVGTGGSLTMTIDPDRNSDDYDFAIWGPFTSSTIQCPPTSSPIRCSWSAVNGNTGLGQIWSVVSSYTYSCGLFGLLTCTGYNYGWVNASDNSEDNYGDGWVAPLTVSAGQIYILLIDGFTSQPNPYSLSWGGTATLSCTPVVLPIELSAFSGKAEGNSNVLSWTTESERDNSYFTLERSLDGINWQTTATVSGAGNSTTALDYTYYDLAFEKNKVNYYRISQTDYDGKREVFDDRIIAIDNTQKGKEILMIYDLQGKEVTSDAKGVIIVRYTDGSIEKRINF